MGVHILWKCTHAHGCFMGVTFQSNGGMSHPLAVSRPHGSTGRCAVRNAGRANHAHFLVNVCSILSQHILSQHMCGRIALWPCAFMGSHLQVVCHLSCVSPLCSHTHPLSGGREVALMCRMLSQVRVHNFILLPHPQ